MAFAPNRNILPGDGAALEKRKLTRTSSLASSLEKPLPASPGEELFLTAKTANPIPSSADILPPPISGNPDFQLAYDLTVQVRAFLSPIGIGGLVSEEKLIKVKQGFTRFNTRIVQVQGEDQARAGILSEIYTLLTGLVEKVEIKKAPSIDPMQSALAEVEAIMRKL